VNVTDPTGPKAPDEKMPSKAQVGLGVGAVEEDETTADELDAGVDELATGMLEPAEDTMADEDIEGVVEPGVQSRAA
jgi:hypothetical protein